MRDIKFRGRIAQGLENAGHWVYWGLNGTDMLDALDPDTIGEYTGLKDKNGTEIYEGDVVTINASAPSGVRNFEIRFIDGAFCLGADGAGGMKTDDFNALRNAIFEARKHSTAGKLIIEVIGNIYENPELLEVTNAI